MTLPTSTRVTDPYETDGVQRDFEFDFPAFYNADTGHYGIEVRRLTALDYEVIDKSLYDIFLNDEDKSGYIRFHVAPMAGDDIYIAGDTTRSQQLNLINYGRYSAQSIEKAFDLIVALIQEFVSKVDEETRQRILADQALRDFLLIKFNQFTAEVTTKIDKHIGDINGFMSSLIPMFVCIMRKEIAYYAETGMMQVINDFMDNEIEPLIAEKVNSYLEQTDFAGAVNQIVAPIAEYVPLPFESQKTYKVNQRVTLSNGDIVKSAVAGNTVNPNVDMTGWVLISDTSQIVDESGKTQQEINNHRPTVLQLNSAIKGDGITDDAVGLQALARVVDTTFKPYMFLSFYNKSYKLGSTVSIQEPMMLWGDAVPTYNRGDGKQGKILLNTLIGFNLGNGRTSGSVLDVNAKTSKNPADQWTVKNIAFFPRDRATQDYTQTAIMFDSKTNGPDRGFLMREVSASRVKHAIRVKDNDVQTHLSNLEVVNCCLSNNELPILADGNVWCGRIVNNQIEQNSQGAIHGVFHAGLTIHDNMLEGNKNTIYIKDHPKDRDGCYLSLERNYFEGNYGEYLVKIESFQRNSIVSRGNYVSGFLSSDGITPNTSNNRPTDHFLLTNIYSSIHILDQLSVSFFGSPSCTEDNNLSRFLVYSGLSGRVRVNSRWNDAVEMRDNSAPLTSVAVKLNTDIGEIYELKNSSAYTDVPLVVQANDCVHLCFSYYSSDSLLAPTSITVVEAGTGGVVLVQEAGFVSGASRGGVVTCNYIFTVPTNATGGRMLRFRLALNDANKTLSIIGASAKKIGTYNASATNNVDNRFIVTKSKPPATRVADGLKFSAVLMETVIAAGATSVKTYTVTGATSSNRVEAVLSSYLADLSVTARVSAVNTIQVSIKNNGAASITIPDTTELSYTIY